MGISPDRCVVIEDSPYGAAAAKAAGMVAYGFAGGGFAEKLANEGARIFDRCLHTRWVRATAPQHREHVGNQLRDDQQCAGCHAAGRPGLEGTRRKRAAAQGRSGVRSGREERGI